jgi:hypothetical protein
MYTNLFSITREAAVRFKAWCVLLVSVALSASFLGCAAAYNARNDFAPDYRRSVDCYIRGAFGRKYYSDTYKKVVVSISSHGPNDRTLLEQDLKRARASGVSVSHPIPGLETKLLFKREYGIRGSDLHWRAEWGPHDSLSIVFYDYGRGVALPYSSMEAAPKRLLRSINYSYDPNTGKYSELSSPRPSSKSSAMPTNPLATSPTSPAPPAGP